MTAISIIFTALLFFVEAGDVFWGMLLFIIAEIGYRAGQVFYNSLLIDVADEDEIGKVSGNGWAIGSFGGIICLVIVLVMIQLNPAKCLDHPPLAGHYSNFLHNFCPAGLLLDQGKPSAAETKREEFIQSSNRSSEEDHRVRKRFQTVHPLHDCRSNL